MTLWKATIIIWSERNPLAMELSELARDAESGSSYVAGFDARQVHDVEKDPDCDEGVEEFFGLGPEDENEN